MIGYIYKIWDNDDPTLVYYGSTEQQVSVRMGKHRAKYSKCKSKIIIDRNNYQYATLEKIEYEDKFELRNRERWYVENNECVNKQVPNRTNKERYIDNRDKNLKCKKIYRAENKNKIEKYKKEKVTCDCGCIVSRNHLTRHKKTNKHLSTI